MNAVNLTDGLCEFGGDPPATNSKGAADGSTKRARLGRLSGLVGHAARLTVSGIEAGPHLGSAQRQE